MSRNVRQKPPVHPVTTPKRRGSASSSLALSDDDGYSAVDDISDSEDDDEDDVNAVEEEMILTEAAARPAVAPRPHPPTDDDDDDDDDEDHDDALDARFGGADADESASWAGIVSDVDESHMSDFHTVLAPVAPPPSVERHVRFDVPSSDSDSTETDDDHADLFPDIFVSQNSLDPAFRREIEHDPDESSGSGSFWDFSGQYEDPRGSDAEDVVRELSDDDAAAATPRPGLPAAGPPDPPPALQDNAELDGYETDGDTTEDDIPEPPVRRKTRRPSNPMSEPSDSNAESPVKPQRGQPRVGRFNLDRSDKKPIAVLNPLTRKMMIFTPHRRRQLDLSPEQFKLPFVVEERSSPLLCNSANMMLSAMFSSNTFGDFVNGQTVGPAEAFFPLASDANTADESSSAPSVQGDDDEEQKLDIDDFITWGDEASTADEAEAGNLWEPSSTPLRPDTAPADVGMLSHINPETVGAFRRNQINQQLILSSQATQDSLAFSAPYNCTAIKGIKSDRFDTAGLPLTPIRRQKKHLHDVARSPLESVAAKRKASGEAGGGHKRQRSISDVNMLRI